MMNPIKILTHNLNIIFSRRLTDFLSEIEHKLHERADNYERAIDARIDEKFGLQMRQNDLHLDERFEKMELKTDERFDAVERRLDSRMETHERRTDKYLLQSRMDIVDR